MIPMLAVATSLVAAEAASAITCLDRVSPKDMVSTGTLRKLNAEEARLGPRPTAAPRTAATSTRSSGG